MWPYPGCTPATSVIGVVHVAPATCRVRYKYVALRNGWDIPGGKTTKNLLDNALPNTTTLLFVFSFCSWTCQKCLGTDTWFNGERKVLGTKTKKFCLSNKETLAQTWQSLDIITRTMPLRSWIYWICLRYQVFLPALYSAVTVAISTQDAKGECDYVFVQIVFSGNSTGLNVWIPTTQPWFGRYP